MSCPMVALHAGQFDQLRTCGHSAHDAMSLRVQPEQGARAALESLPVQLKTQDLWWS